MNGLERFRPACPARGPGWTRALVLIAGAGALAACSPPDGSPKAASGPASVVESIRAAHPAPKKPLDSTSLADFPDAIAQLERLREGVDRISTVDAAETSAMEDLESTRLGLQALHARLRDLPIDEVREVVRGTAVSNDWISAKDEIVTSRLRRIERRLARAAELKATFVSFSTLAEEESAPPGIRVRIRSALTLLEDLEKRLVKRRIEVLVAVDKLADVRGTAAALTAEAESRLAEAQDAVDRLSREPVWRLHTANRQEVRGGADRLERDLSHVRSFVQQNAQLFLLVSLLVLGAAAALLARLRRGAAQTGGAEQPPASQTILRLSWVAAIPVIVVTLVLAAPPGPPAFYTLALLPAAPAAAWIVMKLLGAGVSRTVWVLAASVVILPLRGALESFPLFGRLVFLLQTVPLAAVLALDFRANRWTERIPNPRFTGAVRKVAWLLAATLAASAIGTVGGWTRAASRLGLGALGTLAGMLMVAASYLVLVDVLGIVLSSGGAKRLLSVRHRADDVLAFGTKALRAAALASSVVIALVSFDLLAPALPFLQRLFRTSLALGSMSISVGSVVSFVLVLGAVLFLSRAVSFLLDEELLPRFQLARGMAYAISVSSRYLLLVAGFVLAAGAAGIDLSKIGFLAGALGVGIGFGLQNIVSNFISGLILLFERPIQVGDTVDVAGAVGTVTHIGIRASTVRSGDGAEVVVPNADLISKPLVNWTLSDRKRRFDVVVGVAYGSPLETTAQALLAAAKRTPGVLPAPSPEAFFQTFAASSLDWALRVWVLQDEAAQVLSDLKRAVSDELAKAGIEIPFPQREIRIRPEGQGPGGGMIAP